MSAAELRQAAETLRARANRATPGPWGESTDVNYGDFGWYVPGSPAGETRDDEPGRADATWFSTMHPGVGLALADWLDHEATIGSEDESMGYTIGPRYPGLVLARLINGGAS